MEIIPRGNQCISPHDQSSTYSVVTIECETILESICVVIYDNTSNLGLELVNKAWKVLFCQNRTMETIQQHKFLCCIAVDMFPTTLALVHKQYS